MIAVIMPIPAHARGFVSKDLTTAQTSAKAALGPGFIGRGSANELLFTCPDCKGAPAVTVLLGPGDAGTEARVRSGATTIAGLEDQCRARAPDCRITALAVAPAVGWVSGYQIGGIAGATAVLMRDGDMVVIRSIAADAATARHSVDLLLPVLRAKVIG